jgi:hypothetical protein
MPDAGNGCWTNFQLPNPTSILASMPLTLLLASVRKKWAFNRLQDSLYNIPMRLWSIHPEYLDTQGLVALWREGLLAQKVLRGKTKGFKHHPQLDRFKKHPSPLRAIATYLESVRKEALKRGYRFDEKKIGRGRTRTRIRVSRRELKAEFKLLLGKLKQRDPGLYKRIRALKRIKTHPLFY